MGLVPRLVSLLLLVALAYPSAQGFVPRAPVLYRSSFDPSPVSRTISSTRLFGKLWDRLQIEEDEEPLWYLLNCVAGLELDLLRQCREACEDMPDAIKFVVPTERKTRSHGANRMVTETKVKYQGYVFAKLRLCPQVYDAIQSLDLCRSWMGTVNWKGHKKLPPAPVALNELEVENFGLEEEEYIEEEEEEDDEDAVIVDSGDEESEKDTVDQEALKVYLGLKVEDMIKVTKQGKLFNEDGIVRRLKDGKIFVRFYTYGTMFEEWLEPGDVRKLSGEEILRGLSGPSQPVTQWDFDGPKQRRQDNDYGSRRRGGGLRQNLMSNVKGAGRQRNTARDRTFRGDAYKRDMFGRTDEERRREERNWKWYQEQRRDKGPRAPVSGQVDDEWNFRAGSRPNREDGDDAALSDVDRQWGRQSQRQKRKQGRQERSPDSRRVQSAVNGNDDWSAFVSPASAPAKNDEDDAFFASLMSDLSEDLDSPSTSGNDAEKKSPTKSKVKDEDDFFASLMSELSTENDALKDEGAKSDGTDSTSGGDDFFAALEAELGGFEDAEVGRSDANDDFFAKLEAEMNPLSSAKSEPAVTSDGEEDTISTPDNIKSVGLDSVEETKIEEDKKTSKPAKMKVENAGSGTPEVNSSPDDLGKRTVPQLKEMLRARGLKVSGRKKELIERLTQGQN